MQTCNNVFRKKVSILFEIALIILVIIVIKKNKDKKLKNKVNERRVYQEPYHDEYIRNKQSKTNSPVLNDHYGIPQDKIHGEIHGHDHERSDILCRANFNVSEDFDNIDDELEYQFSNMDGNLSIADLTADIQLTDNYDGSEFLNKLGIDTVGTLF